MEGETMKQDFKNHQADQQNNNCIIIFRITFNCVVADKKTNIKGQNSYPQELTRKLA